MKIYLYLVFLISFGVVKNIDAQIQFERLERVPNEFIERYNQEYNEYNPLHVGDLWQYLFNSNFYVNTKVVKDSIINGRRYFKKISYWHDLVPDRSDCVSWERNDTLSGCSYMLDFEDMDEDGDTLEELPLDSLVLPDRTFYTSYKYSYRLKFGSDPYPGPKNVFIYDTFWVIIWGDTVLSRLVEYSELFHTEYIADKFGMWLFLDELSPYRYLTGAVINGKTYGIIVDVKENIFEIPSTFLLEQNYPNPFNNETTINYFLPTTSKIKLIVYDVLGNEIGTLVNEEKLAGEYHVTFDGSNLTSGIYV